MPATKSPAILTAMANATPIDYGAPEIQVADIETIELVTPNTLRISWAMPHRDADRRAERRVVLHMLIDVALLDEIMDKLSRGTNGDGGGF